VLANASRYAVQALALLAKADGKPLLVKDIAVAAGVPAPYLAKIVQTLAKKGIARTQRGIGGGVALARPAAAISLYDIASTLDDPCVLDRCLLGVQRCTDERCNLCRSFWRPHQASFTSFLKTTTIADVARSDGAVTDGLAGVGQPAHTPA
jgi:Rrf2 family transcriptional regulator, iron-sulfur cluster assembly transcription factor